MNIEELGYKKNKGIYRSLLATILSGVILINLLADWPILSFANFLALAFPIWICTLFFFLWQRKNLEKVFRTYIEKNYPEMLQNLEKGEVEYLEPENSRHIFHLFLERNFVKKNDIAIFKQEVDRISFLLVKTTVICLMSFLLSTVFILRSYG